MADTKDKIADTAGQFSGAGKGFACQCKVRSLPRENTGIRGRKGFYFQRDPDPNCQSGTTKCTGRKPQTDHCRTQGGTGTGKTAAKSASEAPKGAAPVHERPVTAKQPEDFRNHTIHAGKPAMQPASPSIRERGQVPYGRAIAERASVPVVKAASIHHEQTPPIRTERQIVPPASQTNQMKDKRQLLHLLLPIRQDLSRTIRLL